MEAWHVVWVLAAMTGLVSAGIVGSAWAVISGEQPGLAMLGTLAWLHRSVAGALDLRTPGSDPFRDRLA